MRINSVNLYSPVKFFNSDRNPVRISGSTDLEHDVFEKSQVPFKGVPFGVDDNIKKISDEKLLEKTDGIPYKTKMFALISYNTAKITEEMLDTNCGKDNWVFVSIGTSPAGVGKALELMGHDVRYAPISEVGFGQSTREYSTNINEHSLYIKFLDSIGLTKEKINNSDKNYVFTDYTVNGNTLAAVKKFAYEKGVNPNKAYFMSLNNALTSYADWRVWDTEKIFDMDAYFNDLCKFEKLEKYVGIPHVPYYETDSINKCLENKEKTKPAKDFEYALLECIRKDK